MPCVALFVCVHPVLFSKFSVKFPKVYAKVFPEFMPSVGIEQGKLWFFVSAITNGATQPLLPLLELHRLHSKQRAYVLKHYLHYQSSGKLLTMKFG